MPPCALPRYVRVLGDASDDVLHPMNETEQVAAIWVKDDRNRVVHLAEFDSLHQAEQHEGRSHARAHTAFGLSVLDSLEGERAKMLTPFAMCKNHGNMSIWEGRPWAVRLGEKDEL